MAVPDQITFKELLQDPIFKAWIRRKPQIKTTGRKPWRVWVQRKDGGPWGYKDYPTYAQAFNRLVRELREGAWDGALGCPSRQSSRPLVRRGTKPLIRDGKPVRDPKTKEIIRVPNRVRWVMPEGHLWCPYCRRPTRWGYYRKHHALKIPIIIPDEERCRICGCRKSFVRRYHT